MGTSASRACRNRPSRRYSRVMAPTAWLGRGPRRVVLLAVAVGSAATVVSLLPATGVAYRSPTLHVAIETAATLVALLGGMLMLRRFMRLPTRADLMIATALLRLGFTNLFFAVIPWAVDERPGSFDTWAPIAGRLLGAAGLAVGSLLRPR